MRMSTSLVLASAVLSVLAHGQDPVGPKDPAPAPKTEPEVRSQFTREGTPKVTFIAPAAWKAKVHPSGMRLVDYEVPGTVPGTCTVFWFGVQGAGTVEANMARWVGQFESSDKPKQEVLKVSDTIKAHVVEVSGRYQAPVTPGSPEKHDNKEWRLLGAIIETPGGPLYLKTVGPEATLKAARDSFMAFVKSFSTEIEVKKPS